MSVAVTPTKVLEERLAEYARRVEAFLTEYFESSHDAYPELLSAIRYSLLGGGKRVRAALSYTFSEGLLLDVNTANVIASSVEMIHAFSLIHDDLPGMDNDQLRRGRPTCHVAFDEATAILAGDALNTEAFNILATYPAEHFSTQARLNVIALLAEKTGTAGIISGQAMDMAFEKTAPSVSELQRCHNKKTGYLIEASVCLPMLAAGYDANTDEYRAVLKFGSAIGLAFQIQDDILDVTASTEALGKTAGKDIEQHKATYPALLGLSESQQCVKELTQQAVEALSHLHFDVEPCVEVAHWLTSRTH